MKTEFDETQLEHALETLPPEMSEGVDSRLRSAPWTKRGAALRRAPWITALALLVMSAAALATPPGRVWAQGVIGLFTRADSDIQPVNTTAVIPPDPTYQPDLTSVEAQAGFDVLIPDWLPEVVMFKGAAYDSDHQMVQILYYYSSLKYGPGLESNGLALREQKLGASSLCDICDLVGASANIEAVQINGVDGQYVVGVWKAIGDTGQWGWDPEPYVQTLRWQVNEVAYEISSNVIPGEVTKSDLIHMAESLK